MKIHELKKKGLDLRQSVWIERVWMFTENSAYFPNLKEFIWHIIWYYTPDHRHILLAHVHYYFNEDTFHNKFKYKKFR